MKLAQDYLKETASGEARGGFNSRLYGDPLWKCMHMIPNGSRWAQRNGGWTLADEMIRAGKIFSIFKVDGKDLELKCYPDGNQWCCVGAGFTNLQECDAAFANTQTEAVEKYCELYN